MREIIEVGYQPCVSDGVMSAARFGTHLRIGFCCENG
jgi:hypothetical protein